jgi:hypothetical protein
MYGHACATFASRAVLALGLPRFWEPPGYTDIQTRSNVYGHLAPSVHEALGASLDAAYAGSANPDYVQDVPRIGPS